MYVVWCALMLCACCAVWCGVVWCALMLCACCAVRCGVVWCGIVRCGVCGEFLFPHFCNVTVVSIKLKILDWSTGGEFP